MSILSFSFPSVNTAATGKEAAGKGSCIWDAYVKKKTVMDLF